MQIEGIKTRVESAFGVCHERLKLQYEEMLSHFAINLNLRRYTAASDAATAAEHLADAEKTSEGFKEVGPG